MPRRLVPWVLVPVLALAAAAEAFVYFLPGRETWPDGVVLLQLNLGSSPLLSDGCPDWSCVAGAAAAAWNPFLDRVVLQHRENADVRGDRFDGVNSVSFADQVQDEPFGDRTLAVTVAYARFGRIVEADVVFNRKWNWNSYRGPLRPVTRDFRRVAIHEFGHVLGLGHPDTEGQNVPAIMNSTDSDTDDVTLDDVQGAYALYGRGRSGAAVPFPPRNETFDFRVGLETKYRRDLGRPDIDSFVDVEGAVVWTQEYLRYRLNGCSDEQATGRVRQQILGRGVQPVCGAGVAGSAFPPRDQTLAFRQALERIYRDDLGRGTIRTAVDLEGDVVWITEYIRYRLTGCSGPEATARVFQQIDGFGVPPGCGR